MHDHATQTAAEPHAPEMARDEDSETKSQMEKMVDTYDSYMRKITFGREHVLRDVTVEAAQIKPGDRVLEVGCGTGTLSLAAKRKAGESGKVHGIDIIPGMIELSKQKAEKAGLDVSFQLGSIEALPFADSQFDAVMCSFMIFHMSDRVRRNGIKEIFRVLKPNGRLMIIDMSPPIHKVTRAFVKLIVGFMLPHDLKELLPLMEESGFSNMEVRQVKFRVFGLPILSYVRGRKP